MKRFVTEAAKAIAFLAGVGGLLLAADAAGYLVLGILVIASGLLWAAMRVATPRFVEVITRIRNYPSLLRRAADSEAQLTDAGERLKELEAALRTHHEQGVAEGNMQVIGAALAHYTKLLPQLVALSVDGTGAVVLTGRYTPESDIRLGARFEVQVIGTGERKGVVQTTRLDVDAGYVHMKCVERTAEAFWSQLEARAAGDPAPPEGVRLVPAPFPVLETLSPDDVRALVKGERWP